MSTNNRRFQGEIRKICDYPILSGGMRYLAPDQALY